MKEFLIERLEGFKSEYDMTSDSLSIIESFGMNKRDKLFRLKILITEIEYLITMCDELVLIK